MLARLHAGLHASSVGGVVVSNGPSNVIARTFRFTPHLARRLALEAALRKIVGEKPDSQQAIVEQALAMWVHAYGKKDVGPQAKPMKG